MDLLGHKETSDGYRFKNRKACWLIAFLSLLSAIRHDFSTQLLQNLNTTLLTKAQIKNTSDARGCPAAITKNKGIYSSSKSNHWDGVVLITAANMGYWDFLQNWEYLSRVQGLKWAVAALDEKLFEKIGENRSFVTDSTYSIEEGSQFRSKKFNTLSCNKFRMVQRILKDCKCDVVFSDVDNVFLKDPFAHQLGEFIKSGKFDYIYQVNDPKSTNKPSSYVDQKKTKESLFPSEGNTGFHFLSSKSLILQQAIDETLRTCSLPNNIRDDQHLFWTSLRTKFGLRVCNESKLDSSWTFVNQGKVSRRPSDDTQYISLCYLDPYYYRARNSALGGNNKANLIVFHANWVVGKERKIQSLIRNTYEGQGWNESRLLSG